MHVSSDVVYRDRLSSAADKWLFFGLWLAGTIGIIVCKANDRTFAALTVGVLALVAYALAVWRSPRYRVREDRAGDSAYYLGFLFTLTSLAYSLWEFASKHGTTDVIIGNFAIALATTILGLALRVLFQQFREDPIEIEQQVRLEIADRVSQLRSQLFQVVEDLSTLSAAVRHEVKDGFVDSLTQITGAAVTRVQAASDEQLSSMKKSVTAFVSVADEIKAQAVANRAANKRLVESLERLTARIERTEVPTEKVSKAFDDLATLVTDAVAAERERLERDRSAMDSLKELAGSARKSIELVCEDVPRLRESVQQTAREVGALGAALRASSDEAAKQATALETSSGKQRQIWEALITGVDESVGVVRQNQRELATAVSDSHRALAHTQKSLASLAQAVVKELDVR